MPKAMERKIAQQADKKGLTGKRRNAYVYGAMQNKTNWKPGRKKKRGV